MNLIIFFSIFYFYSPGIQSLVLNCGYESEKGFHAYSCAANNSVLTTSADNREISKVQGQHLSEKNNYNVKVFQSDNKEIKFFPRKITKFFENVETVLVNDGNLQEITKHDLEQFGAKLIRLMLSRNRIEVIDADLFEYNKNLETFYIDDNKIKHIETSAFNELKLLNSIDFGPNPCVPQELNDDLTTSHSEVFKLIKIVGKECKDPNYYIKLITSNFAVALKTLQVETEIKYERILGKLSTIENRVRECKKAQYRNGRY